MNLDIKAQWLTALRSGEYQQGQKYLRQGDQYCCLGVLCDLYGKAVGPEWENPAGDGGPHSMLCEDTILPVQVQEWAGFYSSDPIGLASMNDLGSTFEELANIIEEGL